MKNFDYNRFSEECPTFCECLMHIANTTGSEEKCKKWLLDTIGEEEFNKYQKK